MLDNDDGFSDITVELITTTRHVVPFRKLVEWWESSSGDPVERNMKANSRLKL
jgi:hypothetical protein